LPYQAEILPDALKALVKIPRPDQRRIRTRIDELAEHPRPHGSKKLEGLDGLHRICVGDYRVLYVIKDNALIVLVVRIGNRRDVYRNVGPLGVKKKTTRKDSR
jgi:mRNA interferase RelE/StbE